MKTPGLFLGLVAIGGTLSAWAPSISYGIPRPKFTLLVADKNIEIRQYPSLATISSKLRNLNHAEAAFRRLFAFINGKNSASLKIFMTLPVLIEDAPNEGKLIFILPENFVPKNRKKSSIPEPLSPKISISILPPATIATISFRNLTSPISRAHATQNLTNWLHANGHKITGPPTFATYSPPWVPGFLEKNEVWIPITQSK